MSDSSIHHVSDTALWVATYRGEETKREDALFKDPLAEVLAGERGRKIAEKTTGKEMTSWSVVIRTKIIDLMIQKLVGEGVETVINLGAGLDTRPYRLALPSTLRWIEVDYPHVIDLKNKSLAPKNPLCRLERVAVDLANDQARRQFLGKMGQETGKTLILTEGVVLYLTEAQAEGLARDLRAQKNFQFWIVDYFAPAFKKYAQTARRKQMMQNAPFQFLPNDWEGFFRRVGWKPTESKFLVEEGEKWGRPAPIPLWGRILKIFASKKRIEEFKKFMAYVVLEPLP